MDIKTRFHRLKVTLFDPDEQVIGNITTSDTGQQRLTLLFNELARQIIGGSDENWGKKSS